MATSLDNYLKQNPKKHLIFDFDGTIYTLNWDDGEEKSAFRARIWEMFRQIDLSLLMEKEPKELYLIFSKKKNILS